MKTVGIVGGLGTETSCSFCFNINHQIKNLHKIQPHLIMDNVPMSDLMFYQLANGKPPLEVLRLLKDSVIRLNKINSDLVVIPCNTVHLFIKQLRKISKAPILSIIEETVKKCAKSSVQRVGVLGSTTTTKSRLYQEELQKLGIEIVSINKKEQETITKVIIRIINLQSNLEDNNKILRVIDNLKQKGAEAVILGCTDLFLVVKEKESSLPLIDSTTALEEAVISWLGSS